MSRRTDTELMDSYMLVLRCWNNHDLAVRTKMSSERAIALLCECDSAKSKLLRTRASTLLQEIILHQPPIKGVDKMPRKSSR